MPTVEETSGELDIMQLSDSLFPTGLFATSNGIESMFRDGRVTTASELAGFVGTCIRQQLEPFDCVILGGAHGMAESSDRDGIRDIDAVCSASRTVAEVRGASTRSGTQLARCVREFHGTGDILNWYHDEIRSGGVTGAYPVSLAVCCQALGIGRERAALILLYGFVAGSAGAALRLGMIQHFEAQGIIHDLKPLMTDAARRSAGVAAADAWQFLPQIEINQMRHEGMDAKMFIT